MKLSDRIPVQEIEVETIAKSPDVMLCSMANISNLFDDNREQTKQNIISCLKQTGLDDGLLSQVESHVNKINDQPERPTIVRIISKPTQVNAFLMNDPKDSLKNISDKLEPLNLEAEQQKDQVIKKVIEWIKKNKVDDLKCLL